MKSLRAVCYMNVIVKLVIKLKPLQKVDSPSSDVLSFSLIAVSLRASNSCLIRFSVRWCENREASVVQTLGVRGLAVAIRSTSDKFRFM